MRSAISRRSLVKGLSLLPLASLLSPDGTGGEVRSAPAAQDPQSASGPNILILVFDTLSAPHMSLHGYTRQTTPNLERFAGRSTVYHRHYASANFTSPGTATLLTGVYPWRHRAFNYAGTVAEPYERRNLFSAFAGSEYNRMAYTHNWVANFLVHQFQNDMERYFLPDTFYVANGGIAEQVFANDASIAHRSFEHLMFHGGGVPDQDTEIPGSLLLSMLDEDRVEALRREVNQQYQETYPRGVPTLFKTYFLLEDAINGIRDLANSASRPFLGYFHLFPPHEPYKPRREFVGRFDDGWQPVQKPPRFFSQGYGAAFLDRMRREYDEYLANADAEFGRLMDSLQESGRLDDTLIVFTSDHGQLFERGIHGHVTSALYDPLLRVPLLISRPGQQHREDIHTLTNAVDLLPTLCHLGGRPAPDWCDGAVLPGFGAGDADPQRPVFAVEAKRSSKYAPMNQMTAAMIQDRYKLIQYHGFNLSGRYELYDVANDPEELEDLSPSRASIAEEMSAHLDAEIRAAEQDLTA